MQPRLTQKPEEFKYFFETPFSPTEDNFYQCDIDRPSDATADGRMIWANHDLNDSILGILVPAQDDAEDTNSLDSITKQTDICSSNYGRPPNVVMVSAFFCPYHMAQLHHPGAERGEERSIANEFLSAVRLPR